MGSLVVVVRAGPAVLSFVKFTAKKVAARVPQGGVFSVDVHHAPGIPQLALSVYARRWLMTSWGGIRPLSLCAIWVMPDLAREVSIRMLLLCRLKRYENVHVVVYVRCLVCCVAA